MVQPFDFTEVESAGFSPLRHEFVNDPISRSKSPPRPGQGICGHMTNIGNFNCRFHYEYKTYTQKRYTACPHAHEPKARLGFAAEKHCGPTRKLYTCRSCLERVIRGFLSKTDYLSDKFRPLRHREWGQSPTTFTELGRCARRRSSTLLPHPDGSAQHIDFETHSKPLQLLLTHAFFLTID